MRFDELMSDDFILKIRSKITLLLSKTEPIVTTINGEVSSLYLVDKDCFEEFVVLEKSVVGFFTEHGFKEKNPFKHFAKLITPAKISAEKTPSSYKYKIRSKHIHKTIPHPDKVYDDMDTYLSIWINTERKNLREAIKANDWNDEHCHLMNKELDIKIDDTIARAHEIKDNFTQYDVLISNYAENLHYPILYHTLSTGESLNTYLRREVPNILFFEEDNEKALSRSDSVTKKKVETYDSICGTIYFQKKENEA